VSLLNPSGPSLSAIKIFGITSLSTVPILNSKLPPVYHPNVHLGRELEIHYCCSFTLALQLRVRRMVSPFEWVLPEGLDVQLSVIAVLSIGGNIPFGLLEYRLGHGFFRIFLKMIILVSVAYSSQEHDLTRCSLIFFGDLSKAALGRMFSYDVS
jgi:hypothetical protein